jgi:hypothetical protein
MPRTVRDPRLLAQAQVSDVDHRLRRVEYGGTALRWHDVGATGEPAFQNSWVNYGSGYAVASFGKTQQGIVYLKGLVKDGTLGSTIFTLPAGYRPTEIMLFPAWTLNVATVVFARIEVLSDGTVKAVGGGNTAVGIFVQFPVTWW